MPTEPTLTQTQVNALMAKERSKHEAALEKLRADHATIVSAAQGRVAELEGQVVSLTGERDTLGTKLNRADAARTKLQGEHDAFRARTRELRRDLDVNAAFSATKRNTLHEIGRKHALATFLAESALEQDDEGKVLAVAYGGERFTSVADAADKFLDACPYFAAAKPAGSGTPRITFGSSSSPTPDLSQMRPEDLAAEGWREGR